MLETILLVISFSIIAIALVILYKAKIIRVSKEDSSTPQGYENFVKESRDWAFQYIEEVQTGIYQTIDELRPLTKGKSKTSQEIVRIIDNLSALVPPKE
jgi:hypothetical protein